MTVRTPAVRKPRLIGLSAFVSSSLAAHREHADDRGEHADGAGDHREDQAEHPLLRVVGIDRLEGGDAEDDRRDERDLVALEQVGGHAGAVADVVADVVGDRGRVAGVVLGDAGLDLADEVGADVGRLGEDAAADSEEQGEQRAAEPEADEDRRRGVLEDHDDDRGAEQAEADREHAGDAAGAERDLARRRAASPFRGGGGADVARVASVMPMKPVRPDMKQPAMNASVRNSPDSAERERLGVVGLQHRRRREEHDRPRAG